MMKDKLETLSLRLVEGIGSVASLVLHTVAFVAILALGFFIGFTNVLLILTTILSLEAIYLAIFVQMTLNRHTRSLQEVRSDVEELQTDVEEMMDEN